MKIISYNVNGIRAAIRKGLIEWLGEEQPDIICFQEVKAEKEQVELEAFKELGYKYIDWFSATKKGYSGVAIFSKIPPVKVHHGMGISAYDEEGRSIRIDYENFSLINTYFPSGTSGEERQDFKYRFLDDYFLYTQEIQKEQPNLLICGDFNICHKEIDIHNPKRNQKTSGFLPEERAWVSKFIEDVGFFDTFRAFVEDPHRYSWWTYRAGARKKNLGWRIDYFMASNTLKEHITNADILDQVVHSDHCPVTVEVTF
ncbi:exodeoxyribonuclease III [Algivirga pacifica]|uniref:Exodeoxyribonuclease III n=1 Tax=Algivirga pacifica TaxID=1162670 RepID=A0ABP9D766_9BACT